MGYSTLSSLAISFGLLARATQAVFTCHHIRSRVGIPSRAHALIHGFGGELQRASGRSGPGSAALEHGALVVEALNTWLELKQVGAEAIGRSSSSSTSA